MTDTSNALKYQRAFSILSGSAVGVVMTRTKEPFRVNDTLMEYAMGLELNFHTWSISSGWSLYQPSDPPEHRPDPDNVRDALEALRKVGAVDGFGTGVFVMCYPHWVLGRNPAMIQLVKEYVQQFTTVTKRLVLVVPPGFTLSVELEDDVAVLDFDVPAQDELRVIYDQIMDSVADNSDGRRRPNYDDEEVRGILSAGAGMTHYEFENALSRALITKRNDLPDVPAADFTRLVMDVKTEVVKRSDCLELQAPESMANIGGLDNLKAWVAKRRACFSQEARDFGIDAPKGIALIGPPGTGKSLAAKAIAETLGVALLRFDLSRVLQSLVGASEERMRNTLKLVDAMAPCVLFCDEIDKSIQANSGGGDSGVGQRILGVLLTWMQETKAPVFMVMTANKVDNLPPEMLRKGRLDEIFSVTTPTEEERREVFAIHLRKRNHDPDDIEDLEVAIERSSGFTPAEIEAAIKESLVEAFDSGDPVTGALIAEQFANMTPLEVSFGEQFSAMREWAEQNARPASSHSLRVRRRARTRQQAAATGGPRSLALDEDSETSNDDLG